MKRIHFVLFIVFLLATCKKDENIFPPSTGIDFNHISINDTLTIPLQTKVQFLVYSAHEDLTYIWDFGDSTGSQVKIDTHSYAKRGLYKVSVAAHKGDKESESNFFVRVVGQVIGKKSDKPEGIAVLEYNSEVYVFNKKLYTDTLFLHHLREYHEMISKNISLHDAWECYDFEKDNGNNIVCLLSGSFLKFDLAGSMVANVSQDHSALQNDYLKAHIFPSTDNNYVLTRIDSYKAVFNKLNESCQNILHQDLYDNENSAKKCLDAVATSNTEYLLLLNNFFANDYPNDTANLSISISKRNIENGNEINLDFPKVYYNTILSVNDGFIIYGFDLETSCLGCESYLNIVKISSDIKIEWQKKIDLGPKFYDGQPYTDKILVREYDDRYLLFLNDEFYTIDKTGSVSQPKSFFAVFQFHINSVCNSGVNTLILGTVNYSDLHDSSADETYPILFKIDKEGNIID